MRVLDVEGGDEVITEGLAKEAAIVDENCLEEMVVS